MNATHNLISVITSVALVALFGGTSSATRILPLSEAGVLGDEKPSLVYDAATGEFSFDAPRDTDSNEILAPELHIESVSILFSGDQPSVLGGPLDQFLPNMIYKLDNSGIGSISFGNVLPTGLTAATILADIQAFTNTDDDGLDLIMIPEPSTLLLLALGFIGVTAVTRRRA